MWWRKKQSDHVSQQFLEKQLRRAETLREILELYELDSRKKSNQVVPTDVLLNMWDIAERLEGDLAYLKERLK